MNTLETASHSSCRWELKDSLIFDSTRAEAAPLVCLPHDRCTMDGWDTALMNELAKDREIVIFDNADIGRSAALSPTNSGARRTGFRVNAKNDSGAKTYRVSG